MKVKELIELLQKLDQEKNIEIECRQCAAQFDTFKVDEEGEHYVIY